MCQPEKVGTVSPSSDTGTTHVTLVKVPCCQLSYIPYIFKYCEFLVLKITKIVRSRVYYTLQSKSKFCIQNKILNLHSWLVKGWQL